MENINKSVTGVGAVSRDSIINRREFDSLSERFPGVEVASYQAGAGEYFVAEYSYGRLSRLVHYFSPIL